MVTGGVHYFSKNLGFTSKFQHQKGGINKAIFVPTTQIVKPQHTKFSLPADLVPEFLHARMYM